jgi:phospholipid/cholesterol/gamma-HCH transport system permease protein
LPGLCHREATVNSFATSSASGEAVTVTISGDWTLRQGLPSTAKLESLLDRERGIRRLVLEASGLSHWDSALLAFLFMIGRMCRDRSIAVDADALPDGMRMLFELAAAPPASAAAPAGRASVLARIGIAALREVRALSRATRFLGEAIIAFGLFLRGRARYRPTDLFLIIQECGAQALGIVSIISLLVGMIFAFVGAIQLRQFGADIYDANLVAVAMTREMGAVMTGIVLAGRTGAAFAAQIGAMQGNEEVDALSTFGISPVEFLVLPRMLALMLMTPLLCVYADVMGIFGGFVVGINTLNVTPTAYLLQTQHAITLADIVIGIVKSGVFGVLIAVIGCLRGIESGRSAAAVGDATTSAVVTAILAIIVADAVFAILLNILGL